MSFRRTVIGGSRSAWSSVLNFNFLADPGLTYLFLFATIVVAVVLRRGTSPETRVFAFTPKARPIPRTLRAIWWIRNLDASP